MFWMIMSFFSCIKHCNSKNNLLDLYLVQIPLKNAIMSRQSLNVRIKIKYVLLGLSCYQWVPGGREVTPKPRFKNVMLDHQVSIELKLGNNHKSRFWGYLLTPRYPWVPWGRGSSFLRTWGNRSSDLSVCSISLYLKIWRAMKVCPFKVSPFETI